ncbi:MAG: hypothetical protein AAF799_16205 [Myxococcota bacterium]
MPTTYRVKQGDSVIALAEEHGLSAATIWELPENEKLAELRANMNELREGDVLVIPDRQVKRIKVSAGKAHRFQRSSIPAKLKLKVADQGLPRASQDYTLTVGDQVVQGKTNDKGMLEESVPAQAKEGVLVIGPDEFELTIKFGHQDPHDELSGVQRRLSNLGYLDAEPSGKLDDATRLALMDFEARHEIEPNDDPVQASGGVLVDYHLGKQDFASKAERAGPWPAEPKGRKGTMVASFSGGGGDGGKGKGDGSESGDLNVYDEPPPMGYYVIIGRGVTAWYDHLTMLNDTWGRSRLTPQLPVMHLGYAEPWARRRQERMGQWPRMLNFFQGLGPGLELQGVPAENAQDDWLPSATFAANLQRVERHIKDQYLLSIGSDGQMRLNPDAPRATTLVFQNGFVSTIESHQSWVNRGRAGYADANNGLPAAEVQRWQDAVAHGRARMGDGSVWHNNLCPYRISVFDAGNHHFVYAFKIDVCTGPGQPRLFRNNYFATPALYEEHKANDDLPPEAYDQGAPMPRILNGNQYIGSTNNPNETVLVFKGNPVGAQSIQSALDMPGLGHPVQRAWWVVNKSLHNEHMHNDALPAAARNNDRLGNDADVPGRRNLLEQIGNDPLHGDEQQQITDNHPNSANWVQAAYRHARFDNVLMRLGFHEIARFSEHADGQRITVDFNLHPYGSTGRPVPAHIPTMAEMSLASLRHNHGLVADPPEITTAQVADPATGDPREYVNSITVDRVVYSLGQDRGPRSEGTAAYLVQLLDMHCVNLEGFPTYVTCNQADPDTSDQTGRVRILGSAFMGGPGIADGGQRAALDNGHDQHGGTVPQEAPAGGGGMNMAVTNILRANVCTTAPVRVNFASLGELQAAGLSPAAAQYIVAARSMTDRGMTVAGYAGALTAFAAGPEGHRVGGPGGAAADVQLLTNNGQEGTFVF